MRKSPDLVSVVSLRMAGETGYTWPMPVVLQQDADTKIYVIPYWKNERHARQAYRRWTNTAYPGSRYALLRVPYKKFIEVYKHLQEQNTEQLLMAHCNNVKVIQLYKC